EGHPEKRLPNEEGPAETWAVDGAEPGGTHHLDDFVDDGAEPGVGDGVDADEDRRDREQDVLHEVGDDDRHHAAEHRVDQLEKQNSRHDGHEIAAVDTADRHEELPLDLEEHAHVENAAERDDETGENAKAAAVLDLEVLRHRHELEIAESADDETRTP